MMVVWRWVVAAAALAVAATPLRRQDPAVAAGVARWWRAVVAAWTFVFFYIFQKRLPCAEEDARQRKKFRFSALRISLLCAVFDARQRTIAVRVLKNARQSPFTVQNAAVCALPCVSVKNARQRLCRAFLALRRASKRTAKAGFPVVSILMCVGSHQHRLHDDST
jgi:hypothetical protein